MSGAIRALSEARVRILVIDRPEKRNALSVDMYRGLVASLSEAREDAQVRAVLLRGEGQAFTSGNDVADFIQDPPKDNKHPILQFLHALVDFPKPLVAAVDGPAVGIGTTMLLHCDLVYATPQAEFRMPFVPLGLVPEGGSSLLLPRLVGPQAAAELLLLGEPMTAQRAHELGLVNEVLTSNADLLARALKRCGDLARLPPAAVRAAKALLREGGDEVKAAIGREARVFVERLTSPEAMEAMTAFMEKRAPDYERF